MMTQTYTEHDNTEAGVDVCVYIYANMQKRLHMFAKKKDAELNYANMPYAHIYTHAHTQNTAM